MTGVVIVIPAAGASRRMRGGDKLLEEVRGRPLLRERAEVALGLGCSVLVTLPPGGGPRAAVLEGLGERLSVTTVTDAAEGMAASLRSGAEWAQARGAAGLMLLLPDMPDLTHDDLNYALQTFDKKTVLRASSEDGRPGHPVIFPAHLLPEIARLQGDTGAREILLSHLPRLLALPGERAITDLDTPEEWTAWRVRNLKKM